MKIAVAGTGARDIIGSTKKNYEDVYKRQAIDYQALDGAPVRLLFLIAAPDGANDLHIQVLERLAQLLMEPLFCEELKQATDVYKRQSQGCGRWQRRRRTAGARCR